jgi:pimeloyl-ACP methyl ester carboxylesterase
VTEAVDLVLVHGAFHGAWCFEAVEALFREQGMRPTSAELPLETLEGDATTLHRVLDRLDEPVVVLGHSYGGAVVTWGAEHPAVTSLVYVAAVMPDAGEGMAGALAPESTTADPELFKAIESAGAGPVTIDPTVAEESFYGDAEPGQRAAWASRLRPSTIGLGEIVPHAAWRSRPSDYIVCLDDAGLPAEMQRAIATRAGAEIHELPGGHSPFLVRPEAFAELVTSIVRSRVAV